MAGLSSSTQRLVFGLVAAPPQAEAIAAFQALAGRMRQLDDVELERKSCPSYRALAESMRDGTSDIGWLPPVVYAWLAEAVTPLGSILREGKASYSAAVVTLEGGSVHTVDDLRGTRAGWVDPWSAAGYVVPRIELARAGIDPSAWKSEAFHGSHRDTLLALARGDCDVAGTYARTREDVAALEGAWSDIEDLKVRVVATFGSIPPDVIAARRNLAPEPYERALAALRHACTDPETRPLVRAVFGGDEFREGIEPGHSALRLAFERATANGLFD